MDPFIMSMLTVMAIAGFAIIFALIAKRIEKKKNSGSHTPAEHRGG